MKSVLSCCVLVVVCAVTGSAQNQVRRSAANESQAQLLESCSGMSLGPNGALNGFVPAPDDAWHQDISAAGVDPNSAVILSSTSDLGGSWLHPDFSSIGGGGYGIPYTVVDSSQTAKIPVAINLYVDDSDITLAPVPADAGIEANPAACSAVSSDQHMIIVDRNQCVAYEYWQASTCKSAWSASNTALWDLSETEQRPYGFTSADAAGLSVFEGLVRYDEIIAGSVNHAIRFTAKFTKNDTNNGYFTAPATHAAGTLWGTDNIMGMRLRLKASFDISKFSQTNQIILTAMKTYGMILADNGSNLYFQGTPDARWNDSDLSALKAVPSSAFDVVQMGTKYDAATAPTGAAPTIVSFTASPNPAVAGTLVTLTPVVQNASYSYIDRAGFVRGASVVVTPSAKTTYTLTSRNAYGSTTAAVTVNVTTASVAPALSFAAMPSQTVGAAPFAVLATSNSPGVISYSVVSGPATLSGNVVTVTGAGTVTLQASQAASGSYSAATATTSFTVTAAVTSFSLSLAGPGSITVPSGGTAQYALKLTSINLASTVTLGCSGAPAGSVCTVTPSAATLGSPISVAAVVRPEAQIVGSNAKAPTFGARGVILLGMLAPLGLALSRKRWRHSVRIPLLALLVGALVGISGCGSGVVTAGPAGSLPGAGTYALTVNATSGGVTQTANLTLVVQ